MSTPPPQFDGCWASALRSQARTIPWLWHGYLAPGKITLLTSQWKSGKTTLLSILLGRLAGGGTLAGRPIAAGKALVVSEESLSHWEQRLQRAGLDEQVYLICRPFAGKPTLEQWQALLTHIIELHQRHTFALIVFDTLATFLPGRSEAAAGPFLQALLPLYQLTQLGLAVWLMHHPSKGRTLPGQAARGSGALAGFADIVIEMDHCGRPGDDDRRRRLLAFSRFEDTPTQLVIELNAAGTDYEAHGDFATDEFAHTWPVLRALLLSAERPLSREELLAIWPPAEDQPSRATLWRWLDRAVTLEMITCLGTGRPRNPFRYCLPEKLRDWQEDPLFRLMEDDRALAEKLGLD